MSIIEKFNIFTELNQKLVKYTDSIKLIYLTKHILLCVTRVGSVLQYNINYKQLKCFLRFCEKNETITKVVSSYSVLLDKPFIMALTDKGRVFCWGDRRLLPNGCPEPQQMNQNQFIVDVCCGEMHSLLLTRDGDVYTYGDNVYGQCGNDASFISYCTQLIALRVKVPKVVAISCGAQHSIALTDSGEVYGWGDSSREQLGIALKQVNWFADILRQSGITGVGKQLTPIKLNVPKIMEIMCGRYYTLMLSSDGDIYLFGRFDYCLSYYDKTIATKLHSKVKFVKIAATIHSGLCVALSERNICYIMGKSSNERLTIKAKEFQVTEFTSIEETYAFYEQITHKSIIVESYNNEMLRIPPTLSSNTPITNQLPSLMATLDINTSDNNADNDYECHTVSLTRDESTQFGLRLDGGSCDGCNVVIGSILTDGVAHRNGVLCVGDHIISINDRNVTGLTHHSVVQLLSEKYTSVVIIKIRRKRYSTFV